MSRWKQGALGLALLLGGLLGLVSFGPWQAGAAEQRRDAHETMHRMMDAMHGPGASERMHEIEGAEKMMDGCAQMMESMGSMAGMMR